MPALRIAIDGEHLVTVATDGLELLDVSVQGDRLGPERGNLDVSGGAYPSVGSNTHLIWVNRVPFVLGKCLEVTLLESAATSQPGHTIEELFPETEGMPKFEFKQTDEDFNELALRPKMFDRLSFRYQSSLGESYVGSTSPDEHGFGFSVAWNSFHPERVRVSLHTYTLASLRQREPIAYHIETRINCGESVAFGLVA